MQGKARMSGSQTRWWLAAAAIAAAAMAPLEVLTLNRAAAENCKWSGTPPAAVADEIFLDWAIAEHRAAVAVTEGDDRCRTVNGRRVVAKQQQLADRPRQACVVAAAIEKGEG